jgi:iron(III) transport system permease protein
VPIFCVVVTGLVALLVLVPLGFLVLGSFSSSPWPGDFALSELTVGNYRSVYSDPRTYGVLANTLYYVVGAVIIGVVAAVGFAWLVERTNVPAKALLYAGIPLTAAVPSMLQAMAWVLLLSPRAGFINRYLMGWFDLSEPPFNVYTLAGMTLLESLRVVPTAFLMFVPLLRRMDPALEEAATISGSGPFNTFRKVTLPLLVPGLLAVAIYQTVTVLSVFELPGIIGLPGRIYVFSTMVFASTQTTWGIPDYAKASTFAMLYLALMLVGVTIYGRAIRRSERFAVVTGKGYRPRPLDLGRWRYLALGLGLIYLLLSVVLPLLVFLWLSLQPYIRLPTLHALSYLTLDPWREFFASESVWTAIINTVLVTLTTATAVVVLSFLISWIVVRTRWAGRNALDQMAFLPHGVPGIVLGVAFAWVFLKIDIIPIYGTIWALTLGFTVSFLAYGTRAINAGLLQIHKELEEAAQMSGAGRLRTFRGVLLPLMLPTFAGLWIWVFLHATRLAGLPLVLTSNPDSKVLAVLLWQAWDDGEFGVVSAIGVSLIVFLLIVGIGLRYTAFRRHSM